MTSDFWRKQDPEKPLFPDVLWGKPERRDAAGRLVIVGGNSHGFAAVAANFITATRVGVGDVKIILPESLKKTLPPAVKTQFADVVFAPANQSGGLAQEAIGDLRAAANFAGTLLFIGDSGQNSETATLLETFLRENNEIPVVLARDAIDLIKNSAELVLNREKTHLVVSLGQLQKLSRAVYYPRVITFSQGLNQIAETLHKFTTTYPIAITLWHTGFLFIAKNGQVISQKFDQPMRMWSGEIATRETAWSLWSSDIIHASATAWAELSTAS
jgi:hypothetical protein